MPTPETRKPIVFSTEDGLVTFVFTIGTDPSSPRHEPLIKVDISLSWEVGSPLEGVTAEIRVRQPARLEHVSDNGYTLDGSLGLQSVPNGQLAIVGDVYYGDRHDHHLLGVLGIFSPAAG
jgi:hypothetical protein